MTSNAIVTENSLRAHESFEQIIPIRGRDLTIDRIAEVYRELSRINSELGQREVAKLVKDSNTSDAEWEKHKENLLADAFRIVISITGDGDQRIFMENSEIFSSANLPQQIRTIYFNNIAAYKRNANQIEPANKIEVFLDFGKPYLLDPSSLVSEATPNGSEVRINGTDISFFRAAQQVITSKLTNRGTWYGMIHKNFAYDLGLWLFSLPLALFFASHYMDKLFPADSDIVSYRWAFFIYTTGMMLLAYRFLISYAKWAFPVNVLAENKDTAWKHRIVLGGDVSWLCYKVVDIVYGLIVPI